MNGNRHCHRHPDLRILYRRDKGREPLREVVHPERYGSEYPGSHQRPLPRPIVDRTRLVRVDFFGDQPVDQRNYRDPTKKREQHQPLAGRIPKLRDERLASLRQNFYQRDIDHHTGRKAKPHRHQPPRITATGHANHPADRSGEPCQHSQHQWHPNICHRSLSHLPTWH